MPRHTNRPNARPQTQAAVRQSERDRRRKRLAAAKSHPARSIREAQR